MAWGELGLGRKGALAKHCRRLRPIGALVVHIEATQGTVSTGCGDGGDGVARVGMEQALVGPGQALLADPLHGGAAAVFMEGILQRAAGIVAHALQGGKGKGLLKVGQDESKQRIQGMVAP